MKKGCSFSYLSCNLVYSSQSGIYQYLFFTLILLSASSSGSEWNIKCRFPEKNQNVFWTGELISGFIDFVNIDHANLKLERINAELIGEFVYKVVKKTNKSESTSKSQLRFYSERILVHPIGGQSKFSVPYGSHSWPFQIRLSNSLPPSVQTTDSNDPFIHYFLLITFVRPEFLKSNVEKTCPIAVVKNSPLPVNVIKPKEEGKSRKDVHLRIILHKNVVVAGQNILFDVELKNPKKKRINRISVSLIQTLELGPTNTNQLYVVKQDLEKIQKFEWTHFNDTFQLQVPRTTLPTFSFSLPTNSTQQWRAAASYLLKFEAHRPGWFTNIALSLPVNIIGPMKKTTD
jgi:hypothetical protein